MFLSSVLKMLLGLKKLCFGELKTKFHSVRNVFNLVCGTKVKLCMAS